LWTASATPLVISLDSQNQDYRPDLSGPTGNCQKLAAEFRRDRNQAGHEKSAA
jgi:hypothetical protein